MILNVIGPGHDWTLDPCELFLKGPFVTFDHALNIYHNLAFHKLLVHLLQRQNCKPIGQYCVTGVILEL